MMMRCVLMTMLCAAAATGRESGQGARQLYENDILPPRAPTPPRKQLSRTSAGRRQMSSPWHVKLVNTIQLDTFKLQ